jgi:hypothetical protein
VGSNGTNGIDTLRERILPRILKRALPALPLLLLGAAGVAVGDDEGVREGDSSRKILATDVKDGVRREIYVHGTQGREAASVGTPREPLISFIDSPNATCSQPDPRRDECYIEWGYGYVSASTSQYIIGLSFYVGAKVAASISGFFQTSMYVPNELLGRGFKVKCGPPQLPDPNIAPCSTPGCTDPKVLGNAYSYTIRAKETGGLGAANYGTVYCPAFQGAKFYTLPPCRVLDTRSPAGPLAGPALQPSATREFVVSAAACGVPSGAWGVSVNATVTGPLAPGFLTLFAGDSLRPLASTINFSPGQTRANNAVVPLASDFSGRIKVTNGSGGSVHFLLDVNGYFK